MYGILGNEYKPEIHHMLTLVIVVHFGVLINLRSHALNVIFWNRHGGKRTDAYLIRRNNGANTTNTLFFI